MTDHRGVLVTSLLLLAACASSSGTPDAGDSPPDAGDVADAADPDAAVPDAAVPPDATVPPDALVPLQLAVTVVGPGTVDGSPAGTPCGDGCTAYDGATTVTLTPSALSAAVVQGWTGPCAGTAPGEACTFTLDADAAVELTFLCTGDLVVDQVGGDDAASGACGAPFKRITRALTVATAGQTIRVLPGTYDAANGEVFPLTATGVSLIGDEPTRGEATIVAAAGAVAIQAAGTLTIAGLTVRGGSSGVRVNTAGAALTLRRNRLTGNSDAGVWFAAAGTHEVLDNLIHANTVRGVAHISGAPSVKYEGNQIYDQQIGVETNSNGADFGGGALGSAGGNQLYCNTRNDLWLAQGEVLAAQNNAFDHAPPTVGPDGSGHDVYRNGGTPAATTTGAAVVAAPCTTGPATVFAYTGAIQTFTVPAGYTEVLIDALGASGGHTGSYVGGFGASVTTAVPVTGGDVLQILVGQQPALQAGGLDGCGASGGGGSFVVRAGAPLAVAGGGGGAAGYSSYSINGADASLTGDGVASGALLGGTGGAGGASVAYEGGGGGGLTGAGANGEGLGGQAFASGGAGGARATSESCTGSNGGFGGGGGGGNDLAGGGGGYSGGAAQNSSPTGLRAGGGGSFAAGAAPTITLRAAHGHGQVTITPR
jgi:hypothetical protein